MSLDVVRQLTLKSLDEKIAALDRRVSLVRFSPSSLTRDGAYMPPVDAEQVGLVVIDANAERRAYEDAKKILVDVIRRLTSPAQEPEESNKKPDQTESVY